MDNENNELCVVTEFAEGGDMYEVIKECKRRGKLVPENRIWDYLEQVTSGKI